MKNFYIFYGVNKAAAQYVLFDNCPVFEECLSSILNPFDSERFCDDSVQFACSNALLSPRQIPWDTILSIVHEWCVVHLFSIFVFSRSRIGI